MPGIEPETFHIPSRCSNNELCLHYCNLHHCRETDFQAFLFHLFLHCKNSSSKAGFPLKGDAGSHISPLQGEKNRCYFQGVKTHKRERLRLPLFLGVGLPFQEAHSMAAFCHKSKRRKRNFRQKLNVTCSYKPKEAKNCEYTNCLARLDPGQYNSGCNPVPSVVPTQCACVGPTSLAQCGGADQPPMLALWLLGSC